LEGEQEELVPSKLSLWRSFMETPGHVINVIETAAAVAEPYANFTLAHVNDHVVRMSVMTESFYWHRHPNSDETFLVLEGNCS
jgi:hypothetical protein